jgi:hypothetical protein
LKTKDVKKSICVQKRKSSKGGFLFFLERRGNIGRLAGLRIGRVFEERGVFTGRGKEKEVAPKKR